MMLLRSARESDLDDIYLLAKESGVGMTTLPKDKELLKKRLDWTVHSFEKEVTQPGSEYYLFVLEEVATKKIVGTSALEAQTGVEAPFYSYKISKRTRICRSLNIRNDYEVLSLVNDNQGYSELCTLFLKPEYRKNNNGLLLSKARFLFLANNPQRFSSTLIAEMRGFSDDQGRSPFWEHVGAHFFHMPFAEADRLTLATDKQFIADLMPRNALYIELLHNDAKKVIGQPHPSTVPAMNILLKEGFRYNKYVDIFDAGPTIEAPVDQIKTLSKSLTPTINTLCDTLDSSLFLIANTQMNYRALLGNALINKDDNTCSITKDTAALLNLNIGDTLRISPFYS